MELDFYREISELSRINRKVEFLKKAEKLKPYVFARGNPFFIYRLGLELDAKNLPIQDLESCLINCANQYRQLNYLLAWCRNIKQANIERIQQIILNSHSPRHIAEFACFIPKTNFSLLQQRILELGKPEGAYVLIRYAPNKTDIEQFRKLILKSKKPKYLSLLAEYTNSKEELKKIWKLLLTTKSFQLVRRFWNEHLNILPLSELEEYILATQNPIEIKKTFELTKSKRLARYVLLM